MICCAVLALGLVASLFLRYGTGAWLPVGVGLLAAAALVGGVICWSERRNRRLRERMRELERERQAGSRKK